MARNAGNWDQDRFSQADIPNDSSSGFVAGEVDMTPSSIAAEAEADRAAGRRTYGTRGYEDAEAFNRRNR